MSARNSTRRRGWFLILMNNPNGEATPLRALVRKVALAQFGQWMMGTAHAADEHLTISGSYGSDGKPMDVTPDVWALGLEVPAELYDAWKLGGGWNGAGSEASAMRTWAKAHFQELIPESARDPHKKIALVQRPTLMTPQVVVPPPPMATVTNLTPKFKLGRCVITPGARDALQAAGKEAGVYIMRHRCGDWGDLEDSDKAANDADLNPDDPGRILSAYQVTPELKIWINTEWDRSYTTVLLPSEY